ncbi:hypothetical protein KR009_009460 [Drosophila setifemur]|nr:hypothetical protein KR009_009460 [Drosophila setifemur]
MKRQTRVPVSDEQKTQVQAQMQAQNQNPIPNPGQTQTQTQTQIQIQLPVASTSLQSEPQPDQDQDQHQQLQLENDIDREHPVKQGELEQEALETRGAQGDNEQSDNETPDSSTPLPISISIPIPDQPDEGDPAQQKAQQIAKLLTRLGDGAEGDGEANQIVMELLSGESSPLPSASPSPTPLPSPSAIERVSEQLMRVLREQTLMEAGILRGNDRYRCFKCVLQNYAKIYAARRFMEQLPQLELGQELGREPGQGAEVEQELLARVVADEVLQIPELLRQLWSSLEKMEFFNEDAAFKAYLEARRHPQARILRELMLTRISRVFLCIVSSTFFLDFSEHELTHILRNCYLSVNSEIEIFLSVVLWLEHNWFERRDCSERILSEVRFGLMPTWYLATLERANRCRHFARVIHNPGVQRMIAQGLDDAVTLKSKPRASSSSQQETPQQQRQQQEEAHLPREWIADPECRHHHKCHCERFVYPTYDVFKEYLARIICCAPNYWRTFRPAQEVYRSDFRCCSPPHFN